MEVFLGYANLLSFLFLIHHPKKRKRGKKQLTCNVQLKHPASDEFSVVKEKIIHRIVTFFTMLSALIFLVVAVWVLWILRKAEATVRLGVVTAFVVVFAAFLALFTSAKRSDIFATTAAYAAVLVVFLSQGEDASTELAPAS